ncbi:unnamed protein product, partial [Tetraodon nigroviridis]
QQEGLDDGPDFLSEEERGVSVRVGAARWSLCPLRSGSPRPTSPFKRPLHVELHGAVGAGSMLTGWRPLAAAANWAN